MQAFARHHPASDAGLGHTARGNGGKICLVGVVAHCLRNIADGAGLLARLALLQKEQLEDQEDRLKRLMAEFDNFRKRTEKEKTAMFETGARSVIEKILPVVDNFERGFASVPEEEKGTSFAAGMEMVYKQLMTELEKMDVKPIPAVGEEFDPNLHNAVMQVESEEYETGVIAQELQKGYTYRGTVVRHSMVAVVS